MEWADDAASPVALEVLEDHLMNDEAGLAFTLLLTLLLLRGVVEGGETSLSDQVMGGRREVDDGRGLDNNLGRGHDFFAVGGLLLLLHHVV